MVPTPPPRPLPARTEFLTGEATLRALRCAEAHYPAGLELPLHVHEKASVTVVAAGSLVELQGGRRGAVACGPGAAVLRPAGAPHGNAVGAAGVVNLELELDPALLLQHRLELRRSVVVPDRPVRALATRLRDALHGAERASALLAEALALELLALVLPAGPSLPGRARWLDRVHDRIRAEFRAELTVAALAAEAGVHPVHLARVFRARYGCSPAELVRTLRLDWAASQLEAGDRPIGVIALEAGFHDQSHLTRAFRAARGVPPGAFRRARRPRPAPT